MDLAVDKDRHAESASRRSSTETDVIGTNDDGAEPLVALVVDDEEIDRCILRTLLSQLGFATTEADSGAKAVEICRTKLPDVIFMDVIMPGIDGYAAAGAIRESYGDVLVPIIFVTTYVDEEQLAKCIQVGGDDFLLKPIKKSLLRVRTEAVLRTRDVRRAIIAQRDRADRLVAEHQRDMEVAKNILDKVIMCPVLHDPNVVSYLSPMETLNGDILLAAHRPTGGQCFLMGDFTGHGLPAAIGAFTVQGTFMSMVAKGIGIDKIAAELNHKLNEMLPTGRFLSVGLVDIESDTGACCIINAGLPEILVRGENGKIIHRHASNQVPLGILRRVEFEAQITTHVIAPGEQIYVYSDGLIELHDPAGELFGTERLIDALERAPTGNSQDAFNSLMRAAQEFSQDGPQRDDISLLVLRRMNAAERREVVNQGAKLTVSRPAFKWQLTFDLGLDELRNSDPTADIVNTCVSIQGLDAHRSRLYVIFVEMLSNAVEHGLLELDSGIKRDAGRGGFEQYYLLRAERIKNLDDGRVKVFCEHSGSGGSGELRITMSHNGCGFDASSEIVALAENSDYSGRGIGLIRSLCKSLEYHDNGRTSVAVYAWDNADANCQG